MTVQGAISQAFKEQSAGIFDNGKFHLIFLVPYIRVLTGRPWLPDESVTREMRDLRQKGEINYRNIDKSTSYYEKL